MIVARQESDRRLREMRERYAHEAWEREQRDLRIRVGQQEARHAAYTQKQQWRATLDAEMKRREPIIQALETLVNPPQESEW